MRDILACLGIADGPIDSRMREIVFDTETTGLNPAGGDRMVEIGCVEIFNRVETGRNFHAYFNPDRDMPFEAEAVHGLTNLFLSDKPRFSETRRGTARVHRGFAAGRAQCRLRFRLPQLSSSSNAAGRRVCMSRMVDTLPLARTRHPGAKHSLDALCMRFGIDRSHRVKHGALLDAQLLAQVYVELTGGRQIGLGLVAEPGTVSVRQSAGPVIVREPRPRAAACCRAPRNLSVTARLLPSWSIRCGTRFASVSAG